MWNGLADFDIVDVDRLIYECYHSLMKKDEVLNILKVLSSQLKDKKYITLKEVRSIPKLDYYIHFHFRGLGNALKAANLPSSKLAASMSIKSEDLLKYLRDLRNKLGHNPTVWDIQDDEDIYKTYSKNKFTWAIFKTRFNGLRKAIEQMTQEVTKSTSSLSDQIKKVELDVEKDNPEFFQNKNRFFGKAAELHVAAELMYHGFQAANIPVDEGLDILAVKSNKTFYFQVKHKDLSNNEQIHITRSSFEKRGGGDVYYIFVLLSDRIRSFLIIPFHIINDWIRVGLAEEKEKGYSFFIKKNGDNYWLKDVPLDKYRDRWEDIR
jgi:hypothetical protein